MRRSAWMAWAGGVSPRGPLARGRRAAQRGRRPPLSPSPSPPHHTPLHPPLHPQRGADNQTWPFFLLLHPIDHAAFKANRHPVAAGAKPNFLEFPLTGCNTTDNRNWTCPRPPGANPGWTSGSNPSDWALVDQVCARAR